MNTTAILCIARNESPFTEEWLEYHFSIGIDRIYFVSTDDDFNKIKLFIEACKFHSRIELLHFDDFTHGWQMRCYNEQLPLIEEDWVLVIDIDEFLYLNSFPSIGDFLESVGSDIGQIQFPWLNLMSNNYYELQVFDILDQSAKYISDHVKSMFRRECCNFVGIHSHSVDRLKNCLSSGQELPPAPKHGVFLKDHGYHQKHPFVLHFFSRGYLDMLNRILGHKFFNDNNGLAERNRLSSYLNGVANWSNIPTRYLLMKFLTTLPTANAECHLPGIKSKTDLRELVDIFLGNIKKVVDFNGTGGAMPAAYFEYSYRLSEKLSQQELPGICNLDDYLGCSSQHEYINQLRHLLNKTSIA